MAQEAIYTQLSEEDRKRAADLIHGLWEAVENKIVTEGETEIHTVNDLAKLATWAGSQSTECASTPTSTSKRSSSSLSLKRDVQAWIIGSWLWEILACATSLLGVLAIAILLSCYDGHSQPQWPFWINLNTILSMFTTLITASLVLIATSCISQAKWIHYRRETRPLKDFVMFDEASRGPLGSLQALWSLHGSCVIMLGAILTILAIGIGPTVQQMIKIQSHQVNSTFVPTIPRAQSFLQGETASSMAFNIFASPTSGMMGSVYSGMYAGSDEPLGISLDVIPNCPSGNCTFPAFQSLAVCSACNDLTSQLTDECFNETFQYLYDGSQIEQLYCKLSLPNGLAVNYTRNTTLFISTSGYLPLVGTTHYGNSLLNYTKIRGPVYETVQNGSLLDMMLRPNLTIGPLAQQCYLYWCVNTHESRVQNGKTVETLLSSWHSNTTTWLFEEDALNYYHLNLKPDPTSLDYNISRFAFDGLSQWLADLMTLSNSEAYSLDDGLLTSGPSDLVNASSGAWDRFTIFRGANDEPVFANIAKSMTRHVRSVSLEEQTTSDLTQYLMPNMTGVGPALGTEQVEYIYISVRWAWVTLSVALVGLCITLLILTTMDARRNGVEAWKSSPLPILLQGLGKEMKGEKGCMRSMAEMEDAAKDVRMRFCPQQALLSVDERLSG